VRSAQTSWLKLGVNVGLPFAEESEPILIRLLTDNQPVVIASALYALGHLDRGNCARLASFRSHTSADVRCALAYALGGRTDAIAIDALISLSTDGDTDTRNWATFALGSLSDDNSPAIRDALAARLMDADREVRGEAMVGLAERRDDRAIDAILGELGEAEPMTFAIGAAEAMPRSEFLPHLERLQSALPDDQQIHRALVRCREVSTKNR
jgi:HEAT repeat protein